MSVQPTPHEALIYLMVVMSASDRDMTDAELARIGSVIRTMPSFRGFDENRIVEVARECQQMVQEDNGLERVLSLVEKVVPEAAHETAYALAVEVAVADLLIEPEEKRVLQLVRRSLAIDPLVAAAIERGARARHRSLE